MLYVGGNATDGANQDGIRIADGGGGTISDNQIVGLEKANCRYGVAMSGEAIYGRVTDNKISTFTNEGIYITASTARGNHLVDNYLYDVSSSTPISDNGTGTVRSGNVVCSALDSPKIYDPNPIGSGGIKAGTIGGDTSWGAFVWPNSGTAADIGIADAAGTVVAATETGRFGVKSYSKASLPSAASFGARCWVLGAGYWVFGGYSGE